MKTKTGGRAVNAIDRALWMTFILAIGYTGGLMMGTAWASIAEPDCIGGSGTQNVCYVEGCVGGHACSGPANPKCRCIDEGNCNANCENNPPVPCNNPGPQPPLQAEPCDTGSHAECECKDGNSKCSCVTN